LKRAKVIFICIHRVVFLHMAVYTSIKKLGFYNVTWVNILSFIHCAYYFACVMVLSGRKRRKRQSRERGRMDGFFFGTGSRTVTGCSANSARGRATKKPPGGFPGAFGCPCCTIRRLYENPWIVSRTGRVPFPSGGMSRCKPALRLPLSCREIDLPYPSFDLGPGRGLAGRPLARPFLFTSRGIHVEVFAHDPGRKPGDRRPYPER